MKVSRGTHGLILRNKGVEMMIYALLLTLFGILAFSILPNPHTECTTEHNSTPCRLVVNGIPLDTCAYICNDPTGEYIELPFLQIMAALGAEIDQSASKTHVRIVYDDQAYLLNMYDGCLLRDGNDGDDEEYAPLNLFFPAPGSVSRVRYRVNNGVFYINREATLAFFGELRITVRTEMLDENSYYLNIFSR